MRTTAYATAALTIFAVAAFGAFQLARTFNPAWALLVLPFIGLLSLENQSSHTR